MRSTGAVFLGFIVVVALSLGTDQVLHSLGVYPPWGQPMYATGLNLLGLSYRIVYAIVGSYIAARLAPRNPMRHAPDPGRHRGRAELAGCDHRDHHGGRGPGLVPDRARAPDHALRVAGRRTLPREVGRAWNSL
jgi:hypothetical protein